MAVEMTIAHVKREFLGLAQAIAKQNALVRARYPHHHRIYAEFEQTLFGVFADVPVQLHVFLDIAEEALGCSVDERDAFAHGIAKVLSMAKEWAGSPAWDGRGKTKWKKTMPFAAVSAADEIEGRARAFFRCVYALRGGVPKELRTHEKAFWSRYKRMRAAQRKAKKDGHDICIVFLCLRTRVPAPLASKILRLAM